MLINWDKSLNTNFIIILEICQQQTLDIIVIAPRWILVSCCFQMAQLMTYPSVYTLPLTHFSYVKSLLAYLKW